MRSQLRELILCGMAEEPTCLLEAFRRQVEAGHQPQRRGQAAGPRGELVDGADGVEVEAARIDLSDGAEHLVESQHAGDLAFERGHLRRVAREQRQEIELRTDRSLEPAQRVARQEIFETAQRAQHFGAEHRQALADRGRLRRDVVGAAGDHQAAILLDASRQLPQTRDVLDPQEAQRLQHLQLFDVLGQVAAGQPLVDVLEAGQGTELVDARLDVMPRDSLALAYALQVDLRLDAFVGVNRLGGNIQPQRPLRAHDGNPELALEQNLGAWRPDLDHGAAGVAVGQDIRNGRVGGGAHARSIGPHTLPFKHAARLCFRRRDTPLTVVPPSSIFDPTAAVPMRCRPSAWDSRKSNTGSAPSGVGSTW
jgi:hypothetical protein